MLKKVYAGEIAAAVGLKNTRTSDTLCDEDKPIILERIVFPEPVVSLRIEPKTKADQEKMGIALKNFLMKTQHLKLNQTKKHQKQLFQEWENYTLILLWTE